jgi:hypothetical protein
MVFSGGNRNLHVDRDEDAPNRGGQIGVKMTAQYPLPQSPKDPITLLTGLTVIWTRLALSVARQVLISTKHGRASAINSDVLRRRPAPAIRG